MGIIGSFEGYTSSPLYLFNNGTWNNLQTIGISPIEDPALIAVEENSAGYLLFRKANSNNSTPSVVTSSARLNQAVNLTAYNYLNIKISQLLTNVVNSPQIMIGVSTSSTAVSYALSSYIASSGLAVLNIQSLSGVYFIYLKLSVSGVYAGSPGSHIAEITQIFLN